MKHWYDLVMNPARNPLRELPPAQRFQIMLILSLMWTAIFCASAGAWLWYGELMIAHLFVAFGALVTGYTFHRARRPKTHRDYPHRDGTARYDDVWGG